MTLKISRRNLERIFLHSKESCPVEACGILIGTVAGDLRTVVEARRAKNQLSSESSYEIDPESLFGAFTYAEQNELEVVGFYHSHPFWSADASETDDARANYPGLSYLIYSLAKNEAKSYYFDGTRLMNEPVKITSTRKQALGLLGAPARLSRDSSDLHDRQNNFRSSSENSGQSGSESSLLPTA